MQLRLEQPHVKAICKDGSHWALPTETWHAVKSAWMAGKAFWEGESAWGDPIVVKLGDITGLCYKTAAGLALQDAETEEERRRKMLRGEDS